MKKVYLKLVIGLLPILMVLGNSMLIPILPGLQAGLDIENKWSGFILSSFSVPAAMVIPFVGFLSDRFGRGKLIRISLWILIFGSVLCIISGWLKDSFQLFIIGRGLQGIGAAGTTPLAIALVGDLFQGSERSRMLGALEVFNGVGKVIAPIVGATLALLLKWNLIFWIFPVLCIVIIIGIRKNVSGSRSGNIQSVKEYMKEINSVFASKGFLLLPLYAIGGTGLFVLFGILFFLSYHIENTFHIDGFFKGFSFLFPLGAMTISSYWCGKELKANDERGWYFLKWGLGLMFITLGALIQFHSLSLLLFFVTICFGGLGLILPVLNTFVTSSVSESERGFVVSIYGAIRFLGVALGPIAFNKWMVNITEMYVITFVFSISNVLFYIILANRNKKKMASGLQ